MSSNNFPKTIPKAKLRIWISQGKTASQLGKLLELSRPTVMAVIRRDHPEFLKQVQQNGRANHGGARGN